MTVMQTRMFAQIFRLLRNACYSRTSRYGDYFLCPFRRDGRDGSVTIHQDVNLYLAFLSKGDRLTHKIDDNRAVWLQVTKGEVLYHFSF